MKNVRGTLDGQYNYIIQMVMQSYGTENDTRSLGASICGRKSEFSCGINEYGHLLHHFATKVCFNDNKRDCRCSLDFGSNMSLKLAMVVLFIFIELSM